MISLLKLLEQINPIYKVKGTNDFSYRWWIEPSGKTHHFLDTHYDIATKEFGANEPLELLRKGWIRQRGPNFEAVGPLSNKTKDIIFLRAKELGYEKIWVDVKSFNGSYLWHEQLIDREPEALYE